MESRAESREEWRRVEKGGEKGRRVKRGRSLSALAHSGFNACKTRGVRRRTRHYPRNNKTAKLSACPAAPEPSRVDYNREPASLDTSVFEGI